MKKILFVLPFFILWVHSARSQDIPGAMTGAALQQFVNTTISKIQDAGTMLMGNGAVVMGDASTQISALLSQFNSIAQNNINKPIAELSSAVRNLAGQLYSVTSRINAILNQQQSCLVLNTQIVIAGVQGITSGIKNGVPLIKKDEPRLYFFQFENHTANIVPQTGGRIKVVGYDMWEKANLPPFVSVMNEVSKAVLIVKPQRSTDDNSFSFLLSPAFIRQFAGKCLQIKVQPRTTTWYWTTKIMGDYYLPLCIPETYSQEVQLIAHLQYPCIEKKEMVMSEYKNFYFDNTSYDGVTVTHSECWTLPQDAQIIGYAFAPNSPGKRNSSNISVNFAANCLTAAGSLDGASSVKIGFVTKFLHSAFWQGDIAPKISYPVTATNSASAMTAFSPMNNTVTNLCADIDKRCDGNSDNVFWFEIVQKTGVQTKTIYKSPKTTGNLMTDNYQGLQIDAALNSTPVNGKAQICVKITRPQCGF